MTSELFKVNLNGTATLFKSRYVWREFSPDGNYLMVTIHWKPFSYIVPLSRFPSKSAIYGKAEKKWKWLMKIDWNYPKRIYSSSKRKRNMSWEQINLYLCRSFRWRDPANKVELRDEVFFGTHLLKLATPPLKLLNVTTKWFGGNDNTAIVSRWMVW
jgi:hypothetical protein